MSRWVTNGNRVHDNKTGWCVTFASEADADRAKARHNAACDEYEARIAELTAERDALAARINPDGAPVDVAALCVEIDEATTELARVRAIPEPEPPCPCKPFRFKQCTCGAKLSMADIESYAAAHDMWEQFQEALKP